MVTMGTCILNGSLKFEFESHILNYKQDTKSSHFSMTLNHALSAFRVKKMYYGLNPCRTESIRCCHSVY